MHNFVYLAKVHEPLPHPTSNFFSSDFGNSHDPAGLRLGEGHVPLYAPVATLLVLLVTRVV